MDRRIPYLGRDKDIRAILRTTPHLKAGRDEIRRFYENNDDREQRISYIRSVFNNDYTELIIDGDRRVGYKTYQNVLYLWEGSYLSRTAQSYYDWSVISEYFDGLRIRKELYDEIKPLPSMEGQMGLFDEAVQEKASVISQDIIDIALCRGSGFENGKFRIYEQFEKSLSTKENIVFLKNEYGWAGTSSIKTGIGVGENHSGKGIELYTGYEDDDEKILLKWPRVEKRIKELIRLDRYLNSKEKEMYPAWLEEQERKRAEREEAQKEPSLVERLAELAELSIPYDFYEDFPSVSEEDTVEVCEKLLRNRKHAKSLKSDLPHYIDIAMAKGDTEFVEKAQIISEKLRSLYPDYAFSLGDTVYIGSSEYEM